LCLWVSDTGVAAALAGTSESLLDPPRSGLALAAGKRKPRAEDGPLVTPLFDAAAQDQISTGIIIYTRMHRHTGTPPLQWCINANTP
jgi:hypothetical protein